MIAVGSVVTLRSFDYYLTEGIVVEIHTYKHNEQPPGWWSKGPYRVHIRGKVLSCFQYDLCFVRQMDLEEMLTHSDDIVRRCAVKVFQ